MPDKKPNATRLYLRCGRCLGTGEVTPPDEPTGDCPECSGEGYKEVWQADFISTMVYTFEISDNTVVAEYNALSDAQKANYNVILSMGVVNLTAGTTTRASLWSMFDAESTTRTNLLALIS